MGASNDRNARARAKAPTSLGSARTPGAGNAQKKKKKKNKSTGVNKRLHQRRTSDANVRSQTQKDSQSKPTTNAWTTDASLKSVSVKAGPSHIVELWDVKAQMYTKRWPKAYTALFDGQEVIWTAKIEDTPKYVIERWSYKVIKKNTHNKTNKIRSKR